MVFFCGGGAQPACPPAASGTITGTITVANMVGGASTQGIAPPDLASVMRAIRGGASYANMHTSNFPGGEIRGQIPRADD